MTASWAPAGATARPSEPSAAVSPEVGAGALGANLLEVVDDGVITFDGRDITDPRVDGDEVRSRMGMVFQSYNLFPHLSVLGNVTLALRKVHGVPGREADERLREMSWP